MSEYWQSTGPAGFSSHTETQPTLSLLLKNDGGYALTFGCKQVIIDGNIRLERYYEPSEIKLLKEIEKEKVIYFKRFMHELEEIFQDFINDVLDLAHKQAEIYQDLILELVEKENENGNDYT